MSGRVGGTRLAVAAVAAAVVAGSALVVGAGDHGEDCYPSAVDVGPSTVAAGGKVTLTVPANPCGAAHVGARYDVVLFDGTDGRGLRLAQPEIRPDGSVRVRVKVPKDANAGTARLELRSDHFPRCDSDVTQCLYPGASVSITSGAPG